MLAAQAAQQYAPKDRERFMEYVTSDPVAAAQLRAPLYEDKVVDFLFDKATVTDRTATREELEAAIESEDDAIGGHVHGPGCGHDHHDHDHGHDHDHKPKKAAAKKAAPAKADVKEEAEPKKPAAKAKAAPAEKAEKPAAKAKAAPAAEEKAEKAPAKKAAPKKAK